MSRSSDDAVLSVRVRDGRPRAPSPPFTMVPPRRFPRAARRHRHSRRRPGWSVHVVAGGTCRFSSLALAPPAGLAGSRQSVDRQLDVAHRAAGRLERRRVRPRYPRHFGHRDAAAPGPAHRPRDVGSRPPRSIPGPVPGGDGAPGGARHPGRHLPRCRGVRGRARGRTRAASVSHDVPRRGRDRRRPCRAAGAMERRRLPPLPRPGWRQSRRAETASPGPPAARPSAAIR